MADVDATIQHQPLEEKEVIDVIWEFVRGLTFWEWYQIGATIMFIGMVILIKASGQMTAKDVVIGAVLTFTPILNVVALVLIAIAMIIAIFESEDDIIIWKAKE